MKISISKYCGITPPWFFRSGWRRAVRR